MRYYRDDDDDAEVLGCIIGIFLVGAIISAIISTIFAIFETFFSILLTPFGIGGALLVLAIIIFAAYKKARQKQNVKAMQKSAEIKFKNEEQELHAQLLSFLETNAQYINEWHDTINSINSIEQEDYWNTNSAFLSEYQKLQAEGFSYDQIIPGEKIYEYENLLKKLGYCKDDFYKDPQSETLLSKLNAIFEFYEPLTSFNDGKKRELLGYANGIKKGIDGENVVQNYLSTNLLKSEILFKNVVLANPRNGRHFENDFIIINSKGIFTIEVKNYEGGKVYISKEGSVDAGKEENRENFIEQSEMHVAGLKAFLESNTSQLHLNDIVKGIIVFPNDSIEISNESTYPIVRLSLLSHTINSCENRLTEEEVSMLAKLIKGNKRPEMRFNHGPDFIYYKKIFSVRDELLRFLNIFPKEELGKLYTRRNYINSEYNSDKAVAISPEILIDKYHFNYIPCVEYMRCELTSMLQKEYGSGEWSIVENPYIYIHVKGKYYKAFVAVYEKCTVMDEHLCQEFGISSIKKVKMTTREKEVLKENKKKIFIQEYYHF